MSGRTQRLRRCDGLGGPAASATIISACYTGYVVAVSAPFIRSRPLHRAEYDALVAAGHFRGEKIELLYGSLVEMSPSGPPHSGSVQALTKLLIRAVGDRADVRIQSPFAAGNDSEPEPDVAVVPPGRYVAAHPSEAWLIAEVADSSLRVDREVKARLYAECGVAEYWIVNLSDGLVEVHTHPVRGTYTRITPYRRGDTISVARWPDVKIAVADILP